MDQIRQCKDLLRALFREAWLEMERESRVFLDPLQQWVNDLVQRRLPIDWREQLASFLWPWEDEGFRLTPQSVRNLEDWIEAWAHFRGLMPRANELINAESEGQDLMPQAVLKADTSLPRIAANRLSMTRPPYRGLTTDILSDAGKKAPFAQVMFIQRALQLAKLRVDKALDALESYARGVTVVYRPSATTNHRLVNAEDRKVAVQLLRNVKAALIAKPMHFVVNSAHKEQGNETAAYVMFLPFTNIRTGDVIYLNPEFFVPNSAEPADVIMVHELGRLMNWLGETNTGTWKDAYVFRNMVVSLSDQHNRIVSEDAKIARGIRFGT